MRAKDDDSPPDPQAKVVIRLISTRKVGAASGFGKNHPHCVAVFFPKTLQVAAYHFTAGVIGEDCSPRKNS